MAVTTPAANRPVGPNSAGVAQTAANPESTDRSLTGRAAGLPESSAGVAAFAGRCRGRAGARSRRSARLGGAEGAGARVREACAGMLARASDPGRAVSGRQAGSGSARNRARAAAHWPAQGQRFARCRVQRRAEIGMRAGLLLTADTRLRREHGLDGPGSGSARSLREVGDRPCSRIAQRRGALRARMGPPLPSASTWATATHTSTRSAPAARCCASGASAPRRRRWAQH